jgi:predicted nucleic acid-binding protein
VSRTAFLLDTSALISIFEGTPTGRKIADLAGPDFLLSEITCYEISRKGGSMERLLEGYGSLPFDRECRQNAARIYSQAKAAGRMASDYDILIAGTAAARDLVVLTLDRDFERLGVPCKIFRR